MKADAETCMSWIKEGTCQGVYTIMAHNGARKLGILTSVHCTKKPLSSIHQVATMLATSKNVLFQGYNYLLTTGADDLTLLLSPSLVLEQLHSGCYLLGKGGCVFGSVG